MLAGDLAGEGDVIQVVSRAFDVLQMLRGSRGAARQSRNLQPLRPAAIDGVAADPHADADGTAGLPAARPEIPDRPERGGDEHLDDEGLQLRNLIRLRLQDVAEQLPGTVGFVIPDRFHLVYLEYARAANALGLHEITGSRIAMARTAAGHAYAAALDAEVGDALLPRWSAKRPDAAKLAAAASRGQSPLPASEHGYVVACGLWSPHINGLAVPLWSPQYQTFVVVTIGLLSAMFDEKRLHREVAPLMIELGVAVGGAARRRRRRYLQQPAGSQAASGAGPTITRSSRRRRRMIWKPELDELARREAFAREMGGVEKVKRQRDQGRLTVRERIDKLVDADSFHEIGAVSGIGEYDEHGELKHLTPANCVFGRGRIDGRTVVVVGDDFTVRGGSADASI